MRFVPSRVRKIVLLRSAGGVFGLGSFLRIVSRRMSTAHLGKGGPWFILSGVLCLRVRSRYRKLSRGRVVDNVVASWFMLGVA